jgi:hypothetical protein
MVTRTGDAFEDPCEVVACAHGAPHLDKIMNLKLGEVGADLGV